ncbi:hypothetical protein [Actinomadura chibensis]|uniref:Guanylate cyclase domain-containing protein n=1 Tax=Actinomadura chibensis TaxID=392828 RepID=A0A5D0NZA6_9ACTN|nr:hypothetical protein [Actinomadura chibensis]TYB49805.1 hypothetical protein FXF69_12345 [Actinomadura chibensis]
MDSTERRLAPRHRTILATDIEGSTGFPDPGKARLRAVLYRALEDALAAAGLGRRHRDAFVDRGDGVLALIRAVDGVPKTRMFDTVLPALGASLSEHNALDPVHQVRVRVVLHAGETYFDGRGHFGEALDVAFRLLDHERVKEELRRTTAPLVLVTSDDLYRAIVRHGHDGIEPEDFHPSVKARVGDNVHPGWLQTREKTVINMAHHRRGA